MTKKIFFITTAISLGSLSIFLSGCSQAPVSNTANTLNTNQVVVISNTNMNAAPNVSMTNVNGSPMTNNVNTSVSNANRKSAPTTKEPPPQIGSGANDFMLFTQMRGALNSDKELQGVIIEVKEGNVTLSGKLAGADQKAKAEQLVKTVNGIKTVKNNISISK
ncbi:MAG: BON domain-containing protein [Pyrinomonadaceae bacterium]